MLPSDPGRKQWWHNLAVDPDLEILDRGVWVCSRGRVVTPSDDEYEAAAAAYRAKWPRVRMPGTDHSLSSTHLQLSAEAATRTRNGSPSRRDRTFDSSDYAQTGRG
jgi:hypothetical protein